MPVSANVAGKDLVVNELRVKYLVLDSGGYSIVDRSNHIGFRILEEMHFELRDRMRAHALVHHPADEQDLRLHGREAVAQAFRGRTVAG